MKSTETTGNSLQNAAHRNTMRVYSKLLLSRMDEADRTSSRWYASQPSVRAFAFLCICFLLSTTLVAQDWIKTGTGLGVAKVRLAVADFKPATADPQNAAFLKTFNDTLWNDLDVSGVVELVSKSFYPLQVPGQPTEVNFMAWNAPPPDAGMLAFGNLGVTNGHLTVQGW